MIIGTKGCRWALLAVVLAIVGCNDDDNSGATAAAPASGSPATSQTPVHAPSASDDDELVVQGVPSTAASIGAVYSFLPTVVEAGAGTLAFDIANKPAWATFSKTTGQLQGTPTPNDVGTSDNIVIQVTDGTNFTTLPVFSITVPAVALGSATLSWTPPTQNTDGTMLRGLGGYKVYWGTAADDLSNSKTIQNGGLTTYVLENLAPGKYYFAMTAIDQAGIEGKRSLPASKTII
jgi:hypothetical protein